MAEKVEYTKGENPAVVLRRYMDSIEGGITVFDLAEKCRNKISSGTINAILEGKRKIDEDISKEFSIAFKTPKKFFLDVQKEYDKTLKK